MMYFEIVPIVRYCTVINLAVINLAVLKTGSWSLR